MIHSGFGGIDAERLRFNDVAPLNGHSDVDSRAAAESKVTVNRPVEPKPPTTSPIKGAVSSCKDFQEPLDADPDVQPASP